MTEIDYDTKVMNWKRYMFALWLAAGCLACGDSDGESADAAPDSIDAAPPDTAPADATVDAGGALCPDQLLFTGEYVDWNSTPESFLGIPDAEISLAGSADISARTAPNGRVILCVPPGQDTVTFSFTQPMYLPLRYTTTDALLQLGPFSLRGLTEERIAALYETELEVTRDAERALVLVAIQDFQGQDIVPVLGASASLGVDNDGAFVANASGQYSAGDTLTNGLFVLFANVDATAGNTTVTVLGPDGIPCIGPAQIEVAPGELAATTFTCF